MTRAAFAALLSHWVRNPVQLFTLLAGLALATGLWSGVQGINAEARASYDAAASALNEGRYDRLVARDGGAFGQDVFVALRRAGWSFYTFIGAEGCRLMCSWDTREDDIDSFVAALKSALDGKL